MAWSGPGGRAAGLALAYAAPLLEEEGAPRLAGTDRVFDGRADEDEYLIEGTVEGVEISDDAGDEEDEE
jgi:hypothetical protein